MRSFAHPVSCWRHPHICPWIVPSHPRQACNSTWSPLSFLPYLIIISMKGLSYFWTAHCMEHTSKHSSCGGCLLPSLIRGISLLPEALLIWTHFSSTPDEVVFISFAATCFFFSFSFKHAFYRAWSLQALWCPVLLFLWPWSSLAVIWSLSLPSPVMLIMQPVMWPWDHHFLKKSFWTLISPF